jgi:soluble lytic murein transglycosylase
MPHWFKQKASTSVITQKALVLLFIIFVIAILYVIFYYKQIHAYDKIIYNAASTYAIDPHLIRAIIWQESAFKATRVGRAGEIGLMQITEGAACDWAKATKSPVPSRNILFDPSNNVYIGSWYLGRALNYWQQNKPSPLPYALAEYNAGRSNVVRWAKNDGGDPNIFWENITFPLTKKYVREITSRYRKFTRQDIVPKK